MRPKSDLRQEKRQRVLKGAELLFGHHILNAVLLEQSEGGFRVMLIAPAEVPEVIALRLANGAVHVVCRRWQRDMEVGLETLLAAPRGS